MKQMSNSKKFLQIYNKLDSRLQEMAKIKKAADGEYHIQDYVGHTNLLNRFAEENNLVIKRNLKTLTLYARLRNSIVHSDDGSLDGAIAEPHDDVVSFYEDIYKEIVNPKLAFDFYATKIQELRTTTLEEGVRNVVKDMQENDYSAVPVLDGKKLIGVFSRNSIVSYLVKNDIAALDYFKVVEFSDFIPLDSHVGEHYGFISRDTNIYEVQEYFNQGYYGDKRLAGLFVTHNGKEDESILGMITDWDVLTKTSL